MQCVYRATRQGIVGQEQPAKDFDVGVAPVVQYRQETGQPLDDLAVLAEEHFGNTENTVTLDCDDLVIAKQLVNLAHRQPDVLRHIHQLEQGNRRIQDIITIRNRAHRGKFIRSGVPAVYRPAACSKPSLRFGQYAL